MQLGMATKQTDGLFKISVAEYDAVPALRQSLIKEIHRSPAHYLHRLENPLPDSAAFLLGRAVHALILEPDTAANEIAVFTGAVRRGKAWEAFKAENEGKDILSVKEMDQAYRMRDAFLAHPLCRDLYGRPGGEPEISAFWTDEASGIKCKARLDLLKDGVIWDLKTTQSADPESFRESIEKWYLAQPDWYLSGLHAVRPNTVDKFVFIGVEKEPPHGIALYIADQKFLKRSREYNREALRILSQCRETNQFPGYSLEIQTITPEQAS